MREKYPIGIRVDFLNSRYMDDEHRYYDYNLKYSEGSGGFVISVSDEPSIDENTGINEHHYTIRVGMGEVINVPESDLINPNASLSEKVEQRLRQKQENKEFKDTEGRVGGSKKEKRAYKIVNLEDLKNIEQDEATAIELIKKDRIYPKVNVNLEIENGVSSGTAFLKVKMREVYPPQPLNTKRRDAYIALANFNITALNSVYTFEQFTNHCENIKNNIYYILMDILAPNLLEEIESENEIKDQKIKELEKKLEDKNIEFSLEKVRLQNKYSIEYSQFTSFGYQLKNIATEEDKQLYNHLYEQSDDIKVEIESLQNEIIQSEREFAESLVGKKVDKYSMKYINRVVINEILGNKLSKFLNQKDPYDKTFELAFDYDALSEIESKIAIDKNSEYHLKQKDKLEQQIEQSKKLYELDAFKTFFTENSNYGFKGGAFGNKYVYAQNIKNIAEAEAYRERWFNVINSTLKSFNDTLEKVKYKYRERENNWEWFTKVKTPLSSSKKTELVINTLPPLSYIKRVGGYAIAESDINPAFIKEKFGFKDVEFGQSLKDTEAKEHIRHFLGGMADLGDILDLDIIKLNKIGGLSIAFASRGSGKAMAHYESLRKIINITKSKGGGALAHEFMHYIDNILPKIDRSDYNYKDWSSVVKGSKYYYSRNVSNNNVSNTIDDIFNYIDKKKMPFGLGGSENEDSYTYVVISKSDKKYQIPETFYDGKYENIEEYLNLFFKRYSQYQKTENLTQKTRDILGSIVKKFELETYTFKLKTNKSMFLENSSQMKSPYWTKDWELFARAFETYVFDKLEKVGRSNNYLVSGDYFDREEGVYPYGAERKDLFILYDRFIDAIKTNYDLGGFKSWTTERVDEYFVLDKDSNEETGVVVNDETGELIDKVGKYTELQEKFIKLSKMLKGKNNKKKK